MKQVFFRLSPKTIEKLKDISAFYNYQYGGKPSISKLLTAIAEGELVVIKKNFPLPLDK
jgi:hypothetical protein